VTDEEPPGVEEFVEHLMKCRGADAALVGDTGVDLTPHVEMLLANGWTWAGQETIGGKRVRYLVHSTTDQGTRNS
jgi:hypothetical protein